MANPEEIKRKHARFPAFSDDEGVKLKSKRTFGSFSEENWILTEEAGDAFTHSTTEETRTLRRSPKASHEKAGQSIQQREELEKHRKNLPNYGQRYQPEITPTGKKRLFGDNANAGTFKVKEKRTETPKPVVEQPETKRNYFVPKYVPASMIPDEEVPASKVSDSELFSSMAKDSYLLFDTAPAAYQERKDSDPAVRKFKQADKVEMTRSQYRENKKGKKRSVINQSLDGLIKEGATEGSSNGYFN